jgi:hypothetical protein
MADTFTDLAIFDTSTIYGIKSDHTIWKRASGVWSQLPGTALDVSAAPDDALFVAGTDGHLYKWGGSNWSFIGGDSIDTIIAKSATLVYAHRSDDGTFWKWDGSNWTLITAEVTAAGAMYINPGGNLYLDPAMMILGNDISFSAKDHLNNIRNLLKIDTADQIIIGDATGGTMYINTAGPMYFNYHGAYRMVANAYGVSINNGSTGCGSGVGFSVGSGNVGVGLLAAMGMSSKVLHVGGAASSELHLTTTGTGETASDGLSVEIWSDNVAYIWNRENSDMCFGTNATERLKIAASGIITIPGDVGLGATPAQALHVYRAANPAIEIQSASGIGYLAVPTSDGAFSNIAKANDFVLRADNNNLVLAARNAAGEIRFSSGATDSQKAVITSAGDIGIRTPTPGALLDVAQTGGGTGTAIALAARAGNQATYFGNNQIVLGYSGTLNYGHAIKNRHNAGSAACNAIDFFTWKYGDPIATIGGTHVLTIDANGVGIQEAYPDYPLTFPAVKCGKINLYKGLNYGFGVQSGLLQIFCDGASDRTGIGYGTSASFTETLSVKGSKVGIKSTAPGYALDIGGGTGHLYLGADQWPGLGDANGHIIVDTGDYDCLMIVGTNASGNSSHGREVRLWDYLKVENMLEVVNVATLPAATTVNSKRLVTENGWVPANETWTYSSADSPTFVITVPSGVVSKYSPGMKIYLEQSSTGKYFIVTKVADTALTVYGGTDYALASATISNPYYSVVDSPVGFPRDPAKWTTSISYTSNTSQSNPAQNTVYNLGSVSINLPIGAWKVQLHAVVAGERSSAGWVTAFIGLSTSNNSISDTVMIEKIGMASVTAFWKSFFAEFQVAVTSKTAYYVVEYTDATGLSSLTVSGTPTPTTVKAICAYL